MGIKALESHPDFADMMFYIKKNPDNAGYYYSNQQLMMRLSKFMGNVPGSLEPQLKEPTFHDACKSGAYDTVEKHIKAGGSVDIDDENGIKGIAYAVGANRAKVVKLLLESKCDVKEVDAYGNTALHYAAAYGRTELAKYLMTSGCDKSATNSEEMTACDLATK